jgi:hypothetical protein
MATDNRFVCPRCGINTSEAESQRAQLEAIRKIVSDQTATLRGAETAVLRIRAIFGDSGKG